MYNNSGYPIPLVALNSIIMVTIFLNLSCNVCFVAPVYLQIVYKGLNALWNGSATVNVAKFLLILFTS